MKTAHIWPQELTLADGEWLAEAIFESADGKRRTIEYRIPESLGSAISDRHDHFLLAALFASMKAGQACHLHGSVTESLLINLAEFSAIWNAWLPTDYSQLTLKADHALTGRPTHGEAKWLLAFSGGVDASATLLRQTRKTIGIRSRSVKACLMLHGFDVPCNKPEAFAYAKKSAEAIANSVDVPLYSIRTNARSLGDSWEDSFCALLTSGLTLLSSEYTGGIVAGDNGYVRTILPWGSNPMSNHLLGSDHFQIHTDGAELTRMEKVGLLRDWPEALANLRVCWQGPMDGSNCGICEKCVRTQLEFLTLGIDPSCCFKRPLKKGDVSRIVVYNAAQFDLLEEMAAVCDEQNISTWWADELRATVARGIYKATPISKLRGKLMIGTRMRTLRAHLTEREPTLISPTQPGE